MLERPLQPTSCCLYEQDFYEWTQQMAAALQSKQLDRLDWENLAEEIESLERSQKRELRSQLQILLMHLLSPSIAESN